MSQPSSFHQPGHFPEVEGGQVPAACGGNGVELSAPAWHEQQDLQARPGWPVVGAAVIPLHTNWNKQVILFSWKKLGQDAQTRRDPERGCERNGGSECLKVCLCLPTASHASAHAAPLAWKASYSLPR